MDCPICCESRGFNEFRYPACRHPVCLSCVTMLHNMYNGAGQPRCPTCRMELEDPVDAIERQLLDERREWRLQLAEERSRHEREMASARRQLDDERAAWCRQEQQLCNDLARAYIHRLHYVRALAAHSHDLFCAAFEQIEQDCQRENIRVEWSQQASSMYVRLRDKYERFQWNVQAAPQPPAPHQPPQPPAPPAAPQQPPAPPAAPQQPPAPPAAPQQPPAPPAAPQQPPAPPAAPQQQQQPHGEPPVIGGAEGDSPLRALFDVHIRRARTGGVAGGGARMPMPVESAEERGQRRYANPYPMWTTKMRSRRNLL